MTGDLVYNPQRTPNPYLQPQAKWLTFGGFFAFVGSVLLIWKLADPSEVVVAGFALNRLTATLAFLVSAVGSIVIRFSTRYLAGDPTLPAFLKWLGMTLVAAIILMLADNLLILFAAWSAISVGLHRLLTHYPDRPYAIKAARKKFVISRLGDVALVFAIILGWREFGTFHLSQVVAILHTRSLTVNAIAWCVCLAAISKSAQFPFHSWLPETLESPTPVSAFMHAGIINGGGALLLKFAPILARVPSAQLMLSVVGSFTMVVGMLAMGAQGSIKRKLAWSTVAQMGFMTAECGIGAFAAALLHIVGHGFYKATSFLRAGTLPSIDRAKPLGLVTFLLTFLFAASACLVTILVVSPGISRPMTGVTSDFLIEAISSLAVGHGMATLVGYLSNSRQRAFITGVLIVGVAPILGALIAVVYPCIDSLYGMELRLETTSQDAIRTMAMVLPLVTVLGLCLLAPVLSKAAATPLGRKFRTHALNGFYVGPLADRLVAALWNRSFSKVSL